MQRTPLVGRLAPSPTGAQHLGNARTYLIAWLAIRMQKGCMLLRIEDLDTPRTKEWAFQQAIDDLQWLGLDWDIGPGTNRHGFPEMVQSQRLGRYQSVLDHLKSQELIYPCTCSRSDIEQSQSAPHESLLDGAIYPGTCSWRSSSDESELLLKRIPFAWRFRMPDEEGYWEDCFQGGQRLSLRKQLGDFVVARNNGQASYQLAVVVDDHDMGVTQIVRGDDLIPSTFRQKALYDALQWNMPNLHHLPLVVGEDGKRLAKRHGDTRLSSLRNAGIPASWIVGHLAYLSGLIPSSQSISASELLHAADLSRLVSGRIVFDSNNAIEYFQNIMR